MEYKMLNLNKVMVTGRLTRIPGITEVNGRKMFIKFVLAVDNIWKSAEKGFHRETIFIPVQAWYRHYLSDLEKGDAVFVEGELAEPKWIKDGKQQSMLIIFAHKVRKLNKKRNNTETTEDDENVKVDF